jgi:integrase/recombinase XerD
MLGHVRLDTTQIYTHVSIRMLKQVHEATHPAARLDGAEIEDRKGAT